MCVHTQARECHVPWSWSYRQFQASWCRCWEPNWALSQEPSTPDYPVISAPPPGTFRNGGLWRWFRIRARVTAPSPPSWLCASVSFTSGTFLFLCHLHPDLSGCCPEVFLALEGNSGNQFTVHRVYTASASPTSHPDINQHSPPGFPCFLRLFLWTPIGIFLLLDSILSLLLSTQTPSDLAVMWGHSYLLGSCF